MTVLDDFKNKKISFSLTYFGKNDLDTPYTIKTLIDNYTYFTTLIDKNLDNINNVDDYVRWLINNKILNLKECISLIVDENNQKLISNLITSIEGKQRNLVGDLIKFINSNISEIFEYDNFDLHKETLNLIKKYQNGIKESIFEFLIKKRRAYFLYNFNDFSGMFKENIELLKKLIYNDKPLSLDDSAMIVQTINICSLISNYQGEKYGTLSNSVINDIYQKYRISAKDSVDEKNKLLGLIDIGKGLLVFFKNKKDSRANEIIKTNKKLDKNISNYVLNNGMEFKQTISLEKPLKDWISTTSPISRMLRLTHYSDENRTVKSKLSIEDVPNSLMDIVGSNISTDDYYTLMRQQVIEFTAITNSALFIGILEKKEYYTTYFNDFFNLLSMVTKNLNFNSDILEEGKMLIQDISILIANIIEKKSSQSILQKTLNYNVEMLCSALIESLLREQYRIKNEQVMYINYSNVTLGALLNPDINNNGPFSKDQLLTLAFFLINSGENKDIGYNYRNRLAHLFNVYKNSLSLDKVCLLMYLLTDILNTIYVGFLKNGNSAGN